MTTKRPTYIKWLSDRRASSALMIKGLTLIVFFGTDHAVTITPHGVDGVLVSISQAGSHWVDGEDEIEALYDALVHALAGVSYSQTELREFLGLEDECDCADCLGMEDDVYGVDWNDEPLGVLVSFALAADDWQEIGDQEAEAVVDSVLDMFEGSALLTRVLETLEDSEPNASERMCAWRCEGENAKNVELDEACRLDIVHEYLTRHLKIERARPAAHIEEADQAVLTRRLVFADYVNVDRVAPEFAIELALNEPDRSGREIGDYVAFILTESQRRGILGTGEDDCWTLADELAEAVGEARKTHADEVSQIST